VYNDYFTWRPFCRYKIKSFWILLRIRCCRENQNVCFMFKIFFSRHSCLLWDNVERYCWARQVIDGNSIRRMRFACWVTNARKTHLEYVIFIGFAPLQWLRERCWMLRLYVHYPSCSYWCRSCRFCKNVRKLRFVWSCISDITIRRQIMEGCRP